MKANGLVTADVLLAMLANDEDYQRRVRERDFQLAALAEERTRKLSPFTADITAAGIEQTYDPATVLRSGDPRMLSIALDHLARSGYDDETRAAIARHLEVKAASVYWDQIVAAYLAAAGDSERDALAASLAASARAEHVDQLMDLVSDASLGTSRIFFLRPINRLRRGKGKEFVSRLADDPMLRTEATAIMKGRSANA